MREPEMLGPNDRSIGHPEDNARGPSDSSGHLRIDVEVGQLPRPPLQSSWLHPIPSFPDSNFKFIRPRHVRPASTLASISLSVVRGTVVRGTVVRGSVVRGSVVRGSVVRGSVVR